MQTATHQQATEVLGLLSRAQQLFGAPAAPAEPPPFGVPRDLEADLGHGWF